MIHTSLIGGLLGQETEVISINNEPITFTLGRFFRYEFLPEFTKKKFMDHMKSHPSGEKAMERITGSKNDEVKLKQWMHCRFGGSDHTADVDSYGNVQDDEYVPCNKRQTLGGCCSEEGEGCNTILLPDGYKLTKAELRIVQNSFLDEKEIADKLFLSIETVRTHSKNIRKKTGLRSMKEIAIWAVSKGVFSYEFDYNRKAESGMGNFNANDPLRRANQGRYREFAGV